MKLHWLSQSRPTLYFELCHTLLSYNPVAVAADDSTGKAACVAGIPPRLGDSLVAYCTAEKASLADHMDALFRNTEEMEQKTGNVDSFVKLIDKYIDIKELTWDIFHQLIKKCVRYQQANIYYRFIGNINLSF